MATSWIKRIKNSILLKVAPRVLYIFINLLYSTCKKRFHTEFEDELSSPIIVAFWHGELLSILKGYMLYRKSANIYTMVSEHKDGEIIARVISLFGGYAIRGSSTRGGLKALRESFRVVNKKRDLAITPDGPKGPRHSVADGVVLISQKKKVPIVTFNCKPSAYWQFGSWDKFVIPKPFSTLDFYIGKPFYLDDLPIQEAKEILKERLMKNAV